MAIIFKKFIDKFINKDTQDIQEVKTEVLVIEKKINKNNTEIAKTTTAHQSRLQIFQPTRFPTFKERIITNEWGSARIKGKLGQPQADFMEAICHYPEFINELPDGRAELVIDTYKIRMIMGNGELYSYSTLKKIIDDIKCSLIELTKKDQGFVINGIIDEIIEDAIEIHNPSNLSKINNRKRFLWKVILSKVYTKLMKEDLHLNYDPKPIIKLNYGISQAIVRFCTGHKESPNGGWILDNLIKAVGGFNENDSIYKLKDRRKEIKKELEQLKNCGIKIENDRVFLIKKLKC